MMVFQLDKKRIARCFRRSLTTYDTAAIVQNKLAKRLIQSLDKLPEKVFRSVLEVGCCTGGLSELLCHEKNVQTLYLNDLVPDFEEVVFNRLAGFQKTQFLSCFGDIETLPLPDDLSLVISGATFQWLSDLPGFINKLGRELEHGATLAFSLFCPGTLHEFASLTSVELQYHSDEEILSLLKQDFSVESYATYEDKVYFKTVKDILVHIRATGVGGVSEYQWNKETLKQFGKRYLSEFGGKKGIPVSYTSSCYVLRKN